MSSIPEFTDGDILAMKEIIHTAQKIEACLEVIKPIFMKLFGRPSLVVELKRYPRYSIKKTEILKGGSAYSALSLGFNLWGEPTVFISCFCSRQHRMNAIYTDFMTSKKRHQELQCITSKAGTSAWFQKPLSDFITSTNQFEDVRQWFIEKMHI